jgi:hypothetical protein
MGLLWSRSEPLTAALAARPDRQAVLQQFAAGLDPDDAATLRGLLS